MAVVYGSTRRVEIVSGTVLWEDIALCIFPCGTDCLYASVHPVFVWSQVAGGCLEVGR